MSAPAPSTLPPAQPASRRSARTSPDVLCRGFGYPDVVRSLLEETVAAAQRHVGSLGLRAVLLGGSLARGELTCRIDPDAPGGVDLLSDIDAAVFTERRDPARERALAAEVAALGQGHGRSPLFHVDAGVHRLYMKRHTIWTYEFRMGAVTLFGEDVRRLLPRVTSRSLDKGNTAQLILVRLWNQLLHTPLGVVERHPSAYERLIFTYVTARNVLELPTILLPHHGVLLPGYATRDAWLRAHAPVAPGFGPEFVADCTAALAVKRHPESDRVPGARYARLVEWYARLLAHLARQAAGDLPIARSPADDPGVQPLDERYDVGIARAFREKDVLRWRSAGLEARLRLGRLRRGDVVGALGWDVPLATRFLLALHGALARSLSGDGRGADAVLGDAIHLAEQLGWRTAARDDHRGFPRRWQALREWFAGLYGELLYKGNPKKIQAAIDVMRWRG